MFALHPQLAADTHLVEDWALSRVLLMDDSRFPWLILVPRRENVSELHELASEDRAALIEEIARASRALAALFAADKMNIAALGNVVRQLHVHVVARRKDDAAQPGLVWASKPAIPYDDDARERMVARLKIAF
jgi:diadenosine tetraphosphate (Ap4A) HIT family hydrolase